jgi:hypothetical protein
LARHARVEQAVGANRVEKEAELALRKERFVAEVQAGERFDARVGGVAQLLVVGAVVVDLVRADAEGVHAHVEDARGIRIAGRELRGKILRVDAEAITSVAQRDRSVARKDFDLEEAKRAPVKRLPYVVSAAEDQGVAVAVRLVAGEIVAHRALLPGALAAFG